MTITIPHNFVPRDYQIPLYNCLDDGYRRAVAIWHRRCMDGDSHVIMADGSWKYLRDVASGDEILSWDGEKFAPDTVKDVWATGEKECIAHRIKGFKDTVSTPDHRFLANKQSGKPGWTRADEIEEWEAEHRTKYSLFTYSGLPCGETHNPELAEFIGYMVTDGSVNPEQAPKFTNTNRELCERVAELALKLFGYTAKWHEKGNGWDLILSNGTNGGGKTPNKIKEFFREQGSLLAKYDMRLPKILWSMDRESLWAFFGAVMSGDGNIYCQKQTREICGTEIQPHADVKISVGASEEQMWDYYWLLRKIGVLAGDAKNDTREEYNCYTLRIWTNEYIERFLRNIKTIGKESERIQAIDMSAGRYRQYGKRKKYIGDAYRVTITKRTRIVRDTYDLQTEKYGCFVANGYIVHNSGKDKVLINIMAKEAVK